MKKILLGSLLGILINYCISSTYLIYKGVYKNDGFNNSNDDSIN